MPIDTSMYQSLDRPVQVPDPMEAYGRAMSLKAMGQQSQLRSVELQQRQQELALELQKRRDMEVAQKAYVDAGGDMDKFEKGYLAAGGSIPTLQAIKTHDLEQTTKKAQLGKDQWDLTEKKHDRLQGAYNAVATAPPDQQPALWSATVAQLESEGAIPKGQLPAQFPGNDTLKMFGAAISGEKQQMDRAKALREATAAQQATAKATAELPKITAEGEAATQAGWAKKLDAVGKQDPTEYRKLLATVPPEVARLFPREYGPDVLKVGLTPAQQEAKPKITRVTNQQGTWLIDTETNKVTEIRTPEGNPIVRQAPGGQGTLAGQRFDWSKAEAGRKDLEAGMKEHDNLQEQEQAQHRVLISTGRAMQKNDSNKVGQEFIGADGNKYTAGPDTKQALQTKLEGARQKVQDLQRRERKIRQQFKVGEFAQGTPISQMAASEPGAALPAGAGWMAGPVDIQEKTPAGAGQQAPGWQAGTSPAQPAPATQPAAPKKWTVKGVTYSEGQQIRGPGGTLYRVVDVVNGKIRAEPL